MGMIDYIKAPSRAMLMAGEVPAWIENSPRQDYIVQVVLSAPPWVDRAALRALKRRAADLTASTGVLHVLDHIVPLNHPLVCGLTVPWNLQIVPWRVNAAKSNTWCPDQAELFDWPAGTTQEMFA